MFGSCNYSIILLQMEDSIKHMNNSKMNKDHINKLFNDVKTILKNEEIPFHLIWTFESIKEYIESQYPGWYYLSQLVIRSKFAPENRAGILFGFVNKNNKTNELLKTSSSNDLAASKVKSNKKKKDEKTEKENKKIFDIFNTF